VSHIVDRAWKLLTSVKLALGLILAVAALGAASTFIPGSRFFSSPVFFALTAAFCLNLACCAIDRFAGRMSRRAPLRLGSDLVHLGLFVLIAGALITARYRGEGLAYLGEGDSVQLPGGGSLKLVSFAFERWPDGRPKDWVSTVQVTGSDGGVVVPSFAIEVNRPLKLGRMRLYQSTWTIEDTAVLEDATGTEHRLTTGDFLRAGGGNLVFRGRSGDDPSAPAVFDVTDSTGTHRREAPPGATLAGLTLASVSSRTLTGLKAVVDTGSPVALAGFTLAAAGLALWIVRSRRVA
jgi:cytochrome c biogenesis protein